MTMLSNDPRSDVRRLPREFRPSPLGWVAALGAGLVAGLIAGCGTGGSSSGPPMGIAEASHGFGPLLPYRTFQVVNGQVTPTVVAIRSLSDLVNNVRPDNPVLPVNQFPAAAILPNGEAGNHYIAVRFTRPIDPLSVLDPTIGGTVNSGLSGSITLVRIDTTTGETNPIRGRAFVGGSTFAGSLDPNTGLLPFQEWVGLAPGEDGQPKPTALVSGAVGFPGTQSANAFPGAADLVDPRTFVFVVDDDSNLSTHETFPTGTQIRMNITTAVLDTSGNPIGQPGAVTITVGDDNFTPEVSVIPTGGGTLPDITPGNGVADVDPSAPIRVQFTEAVQPLSLGSLPTGAPPAPSSAVQISFGPEDSVTNMPFTVRPPSIYDLSLYELVPAFAFPGKGPAFQSCGTFSTVTVVVNPSQVEDLGGNRNSQAFSTFFEVGSGPGIVNAPVAPDVIYVARGTGTPGISVIDLNGFGMGTGNPTFVAGQPIEGNSNAPNNPNLAFQGASLIPPLSPGQCTINGGSSGVFTLARDSNLDDLLIRPPLLDSVGAMALGQPLDLAINNAPPPFGCQSGNPNVCAISGLKVPTPVVQSASTLAPALPGQFSTVPPGTGNLISWAPHPNPPPLVFPPLCISPSIGGQEPTSIDTQVANLLLPGNPFGNPALGTPPSGLLANEQNTYFVGPSSPQDSPGGCTPFSMRQQVGHFLYVVDRVRRQIVVLNSNRFTVLDRIDLPDPTELAMSPNLDFLAVSNQTAGVVSFIDINPLSATFHQVIQTVKVGAGPRGIAWQPDNEDIFVCNEQEGSVTILRALDFQPRKVLKGNLQQPFAVVLAPRQVAVGHGLQRQTYFGYILGRNGRLSLYQSGPSGLNALGLDDIIASAPATFQNPKALALDRTDLRSGVWIVHENPLNPATGLPKGIFGGAVTNVVLNGLIGIFPPSQVLGAGAGQLNLQVTASIGPETLTGIPVDIAFDNLANLGGLDNPTTVFSQGVPARVNGKNMYRLPGGLGPVPVHAPRYMFLAVPNSSQGGGVVDVINLNSGLQRIDTNPFQPGVQSIPAPGVTGLMDYFRQ